MLSNLLSLLVTWVVSHQPKTFQCLSCVHIEALDCLGKGWNDGFGLADITTTPDSDVDVEQTSVLSEHERQKNSFSLHWHEQGLEKRLAVDVHDSFSWLDLSYGLGLLPLSEAVGSHLGINLGCSFFHWNISSEIKQVKSFELCMIVNVLLFD